jgi:hypothetical protein
MNTHEKETIKNRFDLEEWTLNDPDKSKAAQDANTQRIINQGLKDKMDELDKSLTQDKSNNISDKNLFDINY